MKILLFTLLLLATNLFANIGKVTAVNGDVTITRDTKNLPVSLGFLIEEKDQIKTASNARIQLQFNDKTIISLGKDSVFNVEEYFFDEKQPKKTKASFKMAKGIFKSITGRIGKINPNKFKLKTKSASIGIRGTVFLGTVTPGAPDSIACTTGKIVVSTPEGFVEVPAGQFTTVVPGQAPQKPTKLPKSKANSLENGSG
ncbi:MAG: FecR family protein, partial [Arcobacteraceae bacterium]